MITIASEGCTGVLEVLQDISDNTRSSIGPLPDDDDIEDDDGIKCGLIGAFRHY